MNKKKRKKQSPDLVGEVVRKEIKKHLRKMKLFENYVIGFGFFRKTAEKELTMTDWIERPGIDAKKYKDLVKEVAESLGWKFSESPSMRYFGVVLKQEVRTDG
jgi:hypothetical protein